MMAIARPFAHRTFQTASSLRVKPWRYVSITSPHRSPLAASMRARTSRRWSSEAAQRVVGAVGIRARAGDEQQGSGAQLHRFFVCTA
jgi:hypothetical protein